MSSYLEDDISFLRETVDLSVNDTSSSTLFDSPVLVQHEHYRDSVDQAPRATSPSSSIVSKSARHEREVTVPDDQEGLELGSWIIGPSIGSGTSGRVRIVRHRSKVELGALKMVKKLAAGHERAKHVYREIEVLKIVQHPHIIGLIDVMESRNHLYMVTDYCGCGSLYDWIRGGQAMDAVHVQRYFSQLVSALIHLKLLSIAHRDIKFENIFLYEDEWGQTSLKLGDLGMSTFFTSGSMLETSCGSPHYAAPEVIAGTLYDGCAADIWSSGIVLYGMISRTLPFNNDHIPTLLALIKVGRFEMHDSIQGEARSLIIRMLDKDPETRISIEDVQQHPFVSPSNEALALQGQFYSARENLDKSLLDRMMQVLSLETHEEVARMVLDPSIPNEARYFYLSLINDKEESDTRRQSYLAPSLPSTTFSSIRRSPSAPGSLGDRGSLRSSMISQVDRIQLRRALSMEDTSSGSSPESASRKSSDGASTRDYASSTVEKENVPFPRLETVRPTMKKRSTSISVLTRKLSASFRSSFEGFPSTPSSHDRSSITHSKNSQVGPETPIRASVFDRSLRYSSFGRAISGGSPLESPTVTVKASPLLTSSEWAHAVTSTLAPARPGIKMGVTRKRSWFLGGGARRLSALFGGQDQEAISNTSVQTSSPPLRSPIGKAGSPAANASFSSGSRQATTKRRPQPLSLTRPNDTSSSLRTSPSLLSPRDPRTSFTPGSVLPPMSPTSPRTPLAPISQFDNLSSPSQPHSAPPAFSPGLLGVPPTPTTARATSPSTTFFPTRSQRPSTVRGDANEDLLDENRGLRLEIALLKREIEFKDAELGKALSELRRLKGKSSSS